MQSVPADGISQYIAHCTGDTILKIPIALKESNKTGKESTTTAMRFQIFFLKARIGILLMTIGILFIQASAQQSAPKPDWSAFNFLLGDWTGEGSGDPGRGNGIFTFSLDLQDHILIRRNQSDYPETAKHPAFSHNDLMVMYQEPGKSARAIYFDNENHTIQYSVTISHEGKSITFISDSLAEGPRFKLTYSSLSIDSLLITFEIASPAKPNLFAKYLEGKAHRTNISPLINSEKIKK
jgi:hypothetical protein